MNSKLETLAAGLLYVAIGTALAVKVDAQSKAPMSVAPVSAAPTAAVPACETNKAPDATCTVPLKKGPESKICFSIKHARCFELRDSHLVQTLNDATSADVALNESQASKVKAAIATYQAWLDSELAKQAKSISICRDMVAIDSKSEHKEFCLSKLPRKDVQAKTKDLFSTLENPTGAVKTSH